MEPPPETDVLIVQRKARVVAGYPELWQHMIAEWKSPGSDDRAWLMASANYLFSAAGVRWAIDPLRLSRRLAGAPVVEVVRDLAELAFVVLTHRHADHLDLDLLRGLSRNHTQFIIPEFMLDEVISGTGIQPEQIIVPQPGERLDLGGLQLTAFNGLHLVADASQPGGKRGVPALGYLVEFNRKRWLFPGDVRDYQASRLPEWDGVDGLFAHVWLGRGCARMERPPQLDAFCRFCIQLQPRRVVLTHLEEWGRDADDLWEARHARMVVKEMEKLAPNLPVEYAWMGERVDLDVHS